MEKPEKATLSDSSEAQVGDHVHLCGTVKEILDGGLLVIEFGDGDCCTCPAECCESPGDDAV